MEHLTHRNYFIWRVLSYCAVGVLYQTTGFRLVQFKILHGTFKTHKFPELHSLRLFMNP